MQPESKSLSKVTQNDIDVVHGTLHFKDQYSYLDMLDKFPGMSEDELDEWEESIGFKSYRRVFSESADEFHLLKTEDEFNTWKEKYNDILYMKGDVVTPRIPFYKDQLVVDRSGEYLVGHALTKVMEDKVITILDGDQEKLKEALSVNASLEDSNIKITYIEKPNAIELRSGDSSCYPGKWGATGSIKKGKRKAFIVLRTEIVEPDGYQGLGLYSTGVGLRVYGHKKSIFGWNIYRTLLAYDDVGFQVRDHVGNLHTQYPVSQQSSGNARNLYYRSFVGPLTVLPNPNISDPYFEWLKGRGITRGVGDDHWAVICCDYIYTCPVSTGPDPF